MQLKPNHWSTILSQSLKDVDALLTHLNLSYQQVGLTKGQPLDFPFRITQRYLAKITKGNPHDPLLKQILPTDAEKENHPEYRDDPLKEQKFSIIPGLLHKYYGRILLTLTGACAINCRFCFRKYFSYHSNIIHKGNINLILKYLTEHPDITEVILSGGDPLILDDEKLQWVIDSITSVPHIQTLRFHTRMPVVLPERITEHLLDLLLKSRFKSIFVVHINHPNELDDDILAALNYLTKNGVIVLCQSVLLKGINDCATHLMSLYQSLFKVGVLPYYLHLLDKVTGSHNFEVSLSKAKQIMHMLSTHLPGYLVPKLVYEKPDALYKIPISSSYIDA